MDEHNEQPAVEPSQEAGDPKDERPSGERSKGTKAVLSEAEASLQTPAYTGSCFCLLTACVLAALACFASLLAHRLLLACGAVGFVGGAFVHIVASGSRLRQLFWVPAFALGLGLVLPAIVAQCNDVYSREALQATLCKQQSAAQVHNAQLWYGACQHSSTNQPPGPSLRAYGDSPQQFLYPWMFATLGMLLVWLRYPSHTEQPGRRAFLRCIPTALVLFAAIRWGHYIRLLPDAQPARRIYSYVHHDIALYSGLLNDFLFFCVLLLLSAICFDANDRAVKISRDVDANTSTVPDVTCTTALHAYRTVAENYRYWVVASAGVGAAFIYLTFVYWDIIQVQKDGRYYASAVMIHALWFASWVIVSRPLSRSWRHWTSLRVVVALSARPDTSAPAKMPAESTPAAEQNRAVSHEALAEAQPIDVWGFTGAVFANVAAFVVPIIQELVKGK
jgi:hypothetical protein